MRTGNYMHQQMKINAFQLPRYLAGTRLALPLFGSRDLGLSDWFFLGLLKVKAVTDLNPINIQSPICIRNEPNSNSTLHLVLNIKHIYRIPRYRYLHIIGYSCNYNVIENEIPNLVFAHYIHKSHVAQEPLPGLRVSACWLVSC